MVKVGEIYSSNNCGDFEVVEYLSCSKIKVRFIETGYTRYTRSDHIVDGYIKDPYFPCIYSKAFVGEGTYKANAGGKNTKIYKKWRGMLERCYDVRSRKYHPSYQGVEVCNEWFNFQVFAKWWDTNVPDPVGDNTAWCLDKDLKHIVGNKIYSPETCSIITQKLNSFMTEANSSRGDYKIGVTKSKDNKFISQCNDPFTLKIEYLGRFPTEDLAHEAYKQRKWEHAVELSKLPENAHVAEYILAKYKID